MNRKPNSLNALLAGAAAVIGVLAVAGGLPLASRMTGLISHTVFRDAFFGPALAQLILLVVGCAAFALALHRGLQSLYAAADETGR
ncbi:hypothetical protein ABT127_29835 [Streptomyces sp. NPDC001904]|uniref:hypothetical protein n=1 Tax=Streptomyces sp. NPDC001904 TaxID=3154531 RepID=UPI00332EA32F